MSAKFYYKEVFKVVIEKNLSEMEIRFGKESVMLTRRMKILDPSNGFQSFNSKDVEELANFLLPIMTLVIC